MRTSHHGGPVIKDEIPPQCLGVTARWGCQRLHLDPHCFLNVGCMHRGAYDAFISCLNTRIDAALTRRRVMSGSNGAGLTLRAALASTRYRRERARRAAQEGMTKGGEGEREPDGGGGSAAVGEQPESRGTESGLDRSTEREEHDGG